ncbi:MAG TPA: xanthine dehydrogenase family protein subunit M [Anaerolineales bacterium]|nr:xanthine dehydrogenase family protein subunit M [Anaerolineales bacterium]
MKPAPFQFIAPDTLEEALEALETYGSDAKLLAGGQSLIPAMNFRLTQPAVLIDLNRIASLSYITEDPDGLQIGAMTRQRAVERSARVAERLPLLHEAMPHIAHVQIRNRGTIGGSLAHADPAAELPVIALALDARLHIRSRTGRRTVAAADFFQFMFSTDLGPGEILEEIEFPALPERTGWAFEEFARRKGDYALAGVAAWIRLDDGNVIHSARLVYLNLGVGPVRAVEAETALAGQTPSPDVFRNAGVSAAAEVEPLGNVHATPEYQRHLAAVLTERALARAAARLNGNPA